MINMKTYAEFTKEVLVKITDGANAEVAHTIFEGKSWSREEFIEHQKEMEKFREWLSPSFYNIMKSFFEDYEFSIGLA